MKLSRGGVVGGLAGVVGLGLAQSLFAVTVHVAINGNDANPGTPDQPVATLVKAVELVFKVEEPSEIVIHEGVYPGDLKVGTPEDRAGPARPELLIRAATRADGSFEKVVLDGGRKVAKDEAVPVPGQPGVFKVLGKYTYYARSDMWEADSRVRYIIAADQAAVARYPASFWYNKTEVFFHTSDGAAASTHDIGISSGTAGMVVWRPNVTVRGLEFHSFLSSRWSTGLELRGSFTAAEDCSAWNCHRGFQLMTLNPLIKTSIIPSPGMRVSRCRVDDCGGGVYSQAKGALVEDCRLYKVRDAFMVPNYPQDDTGIQYYSPMDEGVVRRNLCVGFCNGIFIKGNSSQFIVEYNTCLDGITYGMGCTDWNSKSVFRYNLISGFEIPILGHEMLAGANHNHSPSGGASATQPSPEARVPAVVDYNCLWASGGAGKIQAYIDGPRKLGTGVHSIIADPRLAAPSAGDYRLLTDSPCAKLGPNGETCGVMGVVGADFKDVEPPVVKATAGKPAERAAGSGDVYTLHDSRLGGTPNRVQPLPEKEDGGQWITPDANVTIQVDAKDAVSKPAQMVLKVGAEAWGSPRAFEGKVSVRLPAEASTTAVAVKVADVAGNWSEPVILTFRLADKGPVLRWPAVVRANNDGALISFETDGTCLAKVEYGKGTDYGTTAEEPANAQRSWISEGGEPARVTHKVALLSPAVTAGETYHYRLVLEDPLGHKTTTGDATFTAKGEAGTCFVSPTGEDRAGESTREKPWRTIQFAVDRALPGDRVLLLPGLYTGETTLTHGGLASAPITIEADQPGTAVLDARHELPNCLRLDGAPHVIISNLELRWFGRADSFYSYDKAGVNATDSPDVSVLNCRIWNNLIHNDMPIGSGVYVLASPGLKVDHNAIYQIEQGFMLKASPHSRITHNTVLENMYGAVKFYNSTEGTVSKNNSFCFCGNDQFVVNSKDQVEVDTFESDYNNVGTKLRKADPGEVKIAPVEQVFKSVGSKAVISLNSQRFNSLKAWQEATGRDLHSVFLDPKYVDPENGDFHLRPDSPNIGAGEGGVNIGAFGPAEKK